MCGPHFCFMNTRSSGSARVDSTDVLPLGEFRGQTKLIKITEDVMKFADATAINSPARLEIHGRRQNHR